MDAAGPVLLILTIAAILGAVIYISWLQEKRRREALARLAARLGYRFSASAVRGIPGRYDHIDLFRRGHSRRASNVIYGERPPADGNGEAAEVMLFDYRYVTGSGKNRTTHNRSVMLIEMPSRRFPELYIRREGFFDRVAAAVGFDDIDFESHEFSKKYYVKSRDKRFAYDVVDARMMEFLLDVNDINVEMEGSTLAFYLEKRLEVEGIEWLHEVAWDFVRHVPRLALDRAARGLREA